MYCLNSEGSPIFPPAAVPGEQQVGEEGSEAQNEREQREEEEIMLELGDICFPTDNGIITANLAL